MYNKVQNRTRSSQWVHERTHARLPDKFTERQTSREDVHCKILGKDVARFVKVQCMDFLKPFLQPNADRIA